MTAQLRLALENLRRNKVRTALTLIGIVLGITAVVALTSLGIGLQQGIEQQLVSTGTTNIIVQAKSPTPGPPGSNVANPLTKDDLEAVQQTRGVEVAAGRLIVQAILTKNDASTLGIFTTLPEDPVQRSFVIETQQYSIGEGRQVRSPDKEAVTVGSQLGNNPVLDQPLSINDDFEALNSSFRVVGINQETGRFNVDRTILINEEHLRTITDKEDTYDLIIARPTGDPQTVARNIERSLGDERDTEDNPDFTVETDLEAIQSITSVLAVVSGVLAGIGAISLVLGGVSIMNTMYTAVLERTKEIGIMKSIGATQTDIKRIFLFEAGLLGGIGGVGGVALGLGISNAVALIASNALGATFLSASNAAWIPVVAVTFSCLVGGVSGYAPASRAAKKDPVEALRG
jgi:putative ABC transport system permease protein